MKNFILLATSTCMLSGLHSDESAETIKSMNNKLFKKGEAVKEGMLPAGYNKSASYELKDSWDVYFDVDYIYWGWIQNQALSLNLPGSLLGTLTSLSVTPALIQPGYASGVQVGMGFDMKGMDNWIFYSQYTYYKNSGNKSQVANLNEGNPLVNGTISINGNATLRFDMLDVTLQRPFYFGKKLTGNFSTGLKALWISNESNAHGNVNSSISSGALQINGQPTDPFIAQFFYQENSHVASWSLGPVFRFESNWLLGCGFKFLSDVAVSVLYTNYHGANKSHYLGLADDGTNPPINFNNTQNVNVGNLVGIKPMLETFIGLGWGRYVYDDAYHVDLSAGYDFDILQTSKKAIEGSRNLGLHGLNIKFRFDF